MLILEREREREIDRHRERQRERQTDRQTNRQTDRQTDRQIDRQTDRDRDRERTNEFFINEGNGISTILFLHPALGQKNTTKKHTPLNNKNNRKQNN